MVNVDTGGADRLALAVLALYRMATTEQMHLVIALGVRIEQTRRRLVKLREEGLVDRITLPRAGRTRVWFATQYGVEVASEWPELREWRPPRLVSDRTAARLRVGHTLTVTETGLAFLQDGRRRGDICRPLDWIPEVYHPLSNGEAVIPDALLYYRRGDGEDGSMLRAFVEVDRATMGPERLAAQLTAYARLHDYVPTPVGRPRLRGTGTPPGESWKRRYARFPRLLFVLDGPGPAGIETRIRALHASTTEVAGLQACCAPFPSWPPHWSTSSATGPPRLYGGPSRTLSRESAGWAPTALQPPPRSPPPRNRTGPGRPHRGEPPAAEDGWPRGAGPTAMVRGPADHRPDHASIQPPTMNPTMQVTELRTDLPGACAGIGPGHLSCHPQSVLCPQGGAQSSCQPGFSAQGGSGQVLWWTAALWGLAGAAAVEGLALYRAIQRVKDFPWRKKGEAPLPAYLASVAIRAGLGAGLAAAFGASQQVAGPLGALAVGIAAPKIVEQLLQQGLSHQAVEPKPPIAAANMGDTTADAAMRGGSDAA